MAETPKIVGLMCGREFSFPPAFINAVNELGKPHGITAEMVKLGGTKMGEAARYSVIVDRISHEIEYYRGYLKHAVLEGTYVINNPFWWTADDKFFNYAVAAKLGIAIPKTVLLPQKAYPATVDLTAESLKNLDTPSTGKACSTTSAAPRSSSRTRAAAGSTSTRSTTSRSCWRPTTAPRRTA